VVTRLPGERFQAIGRRQGVAAPASEGPGSGPLVGVLALQGDVLEHVRVLREVGARTLPVRDLSALERVDALVLPGGESTTMSRLLQLGGLLEPLKERIDQGLPVLATCAGLILLSDELVEDALPRPGGLAVRTRRNAYGSQTESFETNVAVRGVVGAPMQVSFIRAPRIERVLSDAVEVLAEVAGYPVVVRQAGLLAMAFHPEVSGDVRLHAQFVRDLVQGASR
jgi:pyridoxal 5'-phosphate synthase pdxT subunit